MCPFNSLFIWLSKTRTPKFLTHNLTTGAHLQTHTHLAQFQTHRISLESDHNLPKFNQTPAKIIVTRLQSCANLQELNRNHAQILRTQALHLYPTAFHWNSIIRSYVRHSVPRAAIFLYVHMSRAGISPDSYTLPIALKAVCQIFAVEVGQQLHSVAIKHGLECNEFCESGLIKVYAKAGEFENAVKVFEKNHERKLGSWNAIIGCYAQGGHSKEAMSLFMKLRKCGVKPDNVTMVSVISSCGSLGDLNLALQIHKCAIQAMDLGKSDILSSNSLIDMYGKCGRMDLAYKVFATIVDRNVSTWTSMIMGHAMQGHINEALECFCRMRGAGVRPNYVTFVGVLSACVHGGLVQEGRHYFDMMMDVYGIRPMMQHYGCMVDLLGRAGMLEEAREVVEGMPVRANAVIWGTLLGACEKHRSVEMGEWVARNLVELEPWNDGVYVVLSNIYAGACMWEDVERVRGLMKKRRVAKTPGYSLATVSV